MNFIEKLNLKNVWIYSGIFLILSYLAIAVLLFFDFTFLYVYIITVILGIISIVLTCLICKKYKMNFIFCIILSVISSILTVFSPFACILPLVVMTALETDKKAHILKWVFGITLLGISCYLFVLYLLIAIMATDSGTPRGLMFLYWYLLLFLGFNSPLLILYGMILGNKKSAWYYLLYVAVFSPWIVVGLGYLIEAIHK